MANVDLSSADGAVKFDRANWNFPAVAVELPFGSPARSRERTTQLPQRIDRGHASSIRVEAHPPHHRKRLCYLDLGVGYPGNATSATNRRCGTSYGANDTTSQMCSGSSPEGNLFLRETQVMGRCLNDDECVGYATLSTPSSGGLLSVRPLRILDPEPDLWRGGPEGVWHTFQKIPDCVPTTSPYEENAIVVGISLLSCLFIFGVVVYRRFRMQMARDVHVWKPSQSVVMVCQTKESLLQSQSSTPQFIGSQILVQSGVLESSLVDED